MGFKLARRAVWVVAALVLLTVAAVFAIIVVLPRVPATTEALRTRVVATLEDRLDSDVELGGLSLDVWPRFRAQGEGLVIRHKGRQDVPPLITVRQFAVEATITGLLSRRVSAVRLDGLEIQIPPGDERAEDDDDNGPDQESAEGPGNEVIVNELLAADAKVIFVPREEGKPAKTWAIHDLRMENVGAESAMPFSAWVTNAVPPGEIETHGSFGPWHRTEPGRTPLSGDFVFSKADLGVFKGISGILSSEGTFSGRLGSIEVQGTTDTPDFTVEVGGNPVHLTTTYVAIVNGTDGDTRLEHIDARFLDTRILAVGDVRHTPEGEGREVVLDITIEDSRLEDVLRLAVNTPDPVMTGALAMETGFRLPPGDIDVVDKLELDGAFTITEGRFTDAAVQQQINGLSQRARGDAPQNGQRAAAVTSDFSGRFQLGDGSLRLTPVTFDIPGAVVELNGRYGLQPGTLAFAGNLYMDARVSETMSGWKSFLLKAVDPLFRRDGRTVVPLKVGGTREKPSFGLDMGRVLRRR